MKCKLSEIIDIIGGGTPKTTKEEYWNGTIPWLSVKDFNNDQRYVYVTEKSITELGLVNSSTKLLKKDDIIISARGTVGELAMIPFPMAFNQSCYGLRAKKSLVKPSFLFYLIKYHIESLKKNTHGSVFDTITRDTFSGIEVDIPSLFYQKKIASVLSAFDDKIECNNKINENLQQQAQAVYHEWFDDVGVTMENGILSDICAYSKEKVDVTELNVNTYFSTENMLSDKAGAITASKLPSTLQTTACHRGDTLISNIRPYFKKIVYCYEKCGCSSDVLCFVPIHPEYSAYLYSILYDDRFFNFMVAGSKGTKMPRGDKKQIMTFPVKIPTDFELERFNSLAIPILEQIQNNREENKRLSLLRDTLLPKLMNGEVSL